MTNIISQILKSDKKFLFVFLQCTWGIVQTFIGAIIFILMIRCPHKRYLGCIDTRWKLDRGLSLGLFIFTPDKDTKYTNEIKVHEYGHCIQSMLLGPLYMMIVLISMVWAGLPYFVILRKEKKIPYTACFVESWASKLGEWITGEQAI